jgi:hypothetical protein
MALRTSSIGDRRTVGHVSHDAQGRVDRRVEGILARRTAALWQARLAARRLEARSTVCQTDADEHRR